MDMNMYMCASVDIEEGAVSNHCAPILCGKQRSFALNNNDDDGHQTRFFGVVKFLFSFPMCVSIPLYCRLQMYVTKLQGASETLPLPSLPSLHCNFSFSPQQQQKHRYSLVAIAAVHAQFVVCASLKYVKQMFLNRSIAKNGKSNEKLKG